MSISRRSSHSIPRATGPSLMPEPRRRPPCHAPAAFRTWSEAICSAGYNSGGALISASCGCGANPTTTPTALSACTSSTCSRPLAEHRSAGRRRPGPGLARRGLPRAHLLGRAVRLPVPQPPVPDAHPLAAAVPLPPAGPRPAGRRARRGTEARCIPWQSGSNGREETQTVHLNPRSGRGCRTTRRLQRHVNAAIAFNVWQYYAATGDREFLRTGAPR